MKALELAHEAIRVQIKAQQQLRELVGITSKREYTKPEENEALRDVVKTFAKDKVYGIAKAALSKHERGEGFRAIREELIASLGEEADDAAN